MKIQLIDRSFIFYSLVLVFLCPESACLSVIPGMTASRTYTSVFSVLGSLLLLWFGSPQVHHNLLEFVSNLNPLYCQVPYLHNVPHQPSLKSLSPNNAAPIVESDDLSTPSWFHVVPNYINQYTLPVFDVTKTLLFGYFLHALLIYLTPQKHLFPKIHLIGKLILVIFWITVSWVSSTDWELNDFSLAPLTYK